MLKNAYFFLPSQLWISEIDMFGFLFCQSIDDIAQGQKWTINVSSLFQPNSAILKEPNLIIAILNLTPAQSIRTLIC